ncbi:MAG: hypothetical protein PHT12_00590 [Patescibacteria group bacterium]|nr:hypothetical protein [Patescibacteria group bacterium]
MTDPKDIPGWRTACGARARLVRAVRTFCVCQARTWQTLPLKALLATDLTLPQPDPACIELGQELSLRRLTYHFGFWPIRATLDQERHYHAYVDCLTGELVDPSLLHARQEIVPAHDDTVGLLAWHMDELDAAAIAAALDAEGERLFRVRSRARCLQRATQGKLNLGAHIRRRCAWPPLIAT